MAWTTPQTWSAGTLVDAAALNTYLSANMAELAAIVIQQQFENLGTSAITTTSTTDVLVGANFTKAIDIKNNRALIIGSGIFHTAGAGTVIVSLYVNSVLVVELTRSNSSAATPTNVQPFLYQITGLTPGTNQFDLYWRITTGTATLDKTNFPGMFNVREN